ncbi:MAG: malate dehydrogenase [Candidatus Riflebacteria bacterium]|nr:malate dehydrogenase [Candidatus Riflebacteria bacterium]
MGHLNNKNNLKRFENIFSDPEKVLDYHSSFPPGKIVVLPSKPCLSKQDLTLAYTPGVAIPSLLIKENPEFAYNYTGKGNLVAVISNGTAVLGLGNIGPLAGKPVMEGKALLFKKFAGIDAFDIEINTEDPSQLINCVKLISGTFGGINLEDIKSPECFSIEEELIESLNIPVFHDDQHGTAIVVAAALINSLRLNGKKIENLRTVFCGAGAAGIAIARLLTKMGLDKNNVIMCDIHGVVYKGRKEDMNRWKDPFAAETSFRTLTEAIKGADLFIGVSGPNLLSDGGLKSMNKDPMVFALANPIPEISFERAVGIRSDVLIATGRSDFPNQINNLLGFPYIFRGALDSRARIINDEMKMAAANAIAKLALEPITSEVLNAYGLQSLSFGREYLIPKPFDSRLFERVSFAVAEAAIKSGSSRMDEDFLAAYSRKLRTREILR